MKTEKKTEQVTVEYWSCLCNSHRHKSRLAAQQCIDKQIRAAEFKKSSPKWSSEDLAGILKKYRDGVKVSALAKEYARSATTIGYLLCRAERIEQRRSLGDPMELLSIRARNSLLSADIATFDQLKQALKNGGLQGLKNFGAVSFREVSELVEKHS